VASYQDFDMTHSRFELDDRNDRIEELENQLSSMVSVRDLTIRDLRAQLQILQDQVDGSVYHSLQEAETQAELREERERTDALVAALPKCDNHSDRPATKAACRGGPRLCDQCGAGGGYYQETPDYPRAEPLRAILQHRASISVKP
jgi:hypothetical protein